MWLGETQVRPTAMLWRNIAAMAIEEMLRANPIDGVVLLGGCDKTIPALLMAAASVDLPAVVVPGGPMLTGTFRGVPLGCGTDVWRLSEEVRAGTLSGASSSIGVVDDPQPGALQHHGHGVDDGPARRGAGDGAAGHGGPARAGQPAAAGAHETGRLAVELVAAGRRPSQVLTGGSFRNAIVALAALGGSTNAVVHLLAIAGRLGVAADPRRLRPDRPDVPLLVDLQPAGRFLMEDFHRAGGLLAVLREVRGPARPGRSDRDWPAAGRLPRRRRDLGQRGDRGRARAAAGRCRHRGAAWQPRAGGAVIKPAAASPHLLRHRGRAVVFDSIEDLHARLDDPDLDVDADSVLVLRGCGPKGYPGMPEVSNMPLPRKLLEQGVRDMVRICDGRMSGTAYGTVVLHVAPEAAAGGPLGMVRTGDSVVLDVRGRRIDVDVPAAELAAARRPRPWSRRSPAAPRAGSGCTSTPCSRRTPAPTSTSCVGASGARGLRESH